MATSTATILEEAAAVTSGDRQQTYGAPAASHRSIAALWNVYLAGRRNPVGPIDAADVARMMILVKLARDAYSPQRDNLVDIAGYARCLEQIMGARP